MSEREIERLAAEALSGFDTEKHYVVKVVYADGVSLKSVRYYCNSYEGLDPLLDGLMDDDMVDLEVTATSLTLEDFLSLGMNLQTYIESEDL